MEKDEFYASARNDLSGPLAGVTVVEATTTWAGPMAACVLADFGARVIKVEHPNGEVARGLPPFIPESNLTVANEINRDDLASMGALDHIEQRDLVDGVLADYCSNKTVADVVERFAELGLPATVSDLVKTSC